MVVKVMTLDPYQRPVLAPLGILFPFPVHCTLLDSYLQTEEELRESIKRGAHLKRFLTFLKRKIDVFCFNLIICYMCH